MVLLIDEFVGRVVPRPEISSFRSSVSDPLPGVTTSVAFSALEIRSSLIVSFTDTIGAGASVRAIDGSLDPSWNTTFCSFGSTRIIPSGISKPGGGPSGSGILCSPTMISWSSRCFSHAPNPSAMTESYTNEAPALGLTT